MNEIDISFYSSSTWRNPWHHFPVIENIVYDSWFLERWEFFFFGKVRSKRIYFSYNVLDHRLRYFPCKAANIFILEKKKKKTILNNFLRGGRNVEWHFVENSKKESICQNYSKNNLWKIPLDLKFLKNNYLSRYFHPLTLLRSPQTVLSSPNTSSAPYRPWFFVSIGGEHHSSNEVIYHLFFWSTLSISTKWFWQIE